MALAPILVSVYNRKQHFVNCIESLVKNRLASESILYVVSDAAYRVEDEFVIESIREYVLNIKGFKEVRSIFRERNFGSHESIYQAMNLVLGKFGSMIFLEDDILTSVNFLEYMNDGLKTYENDGRIITITGYAPPFNIPSFYKKSIWVNRRHCAWGFATWDKKWREINFTHFDRYSEIIKNKKNLKKFNDDGADLLDILKSDSIGQFEAMDIRICYHQCLYDKLTIYPVVSKTFNTGFDGTGVRCGTSDEYNVVLDKGSEKISFPDNLVENYLLKLIAKGFYENKNIIKVAFPIIDEFKIKIKIQYKKIKKMLR